MLLALTFTPVTDTDQMPLQEPAVRQPPRLRPAAITHANREPQ